MDNNEARLLLSVPNRSSTETLVRALYKTIRLSETVNDEHLARRGMQAFVVVLEEQKTITQEQAMIILSYLKDSRSSSRVSVINQLREALAEAEAYGIELPEELLSTQKK